MERRRSGERKGGGRHVASLSHLLSFFFSKKSEGKLARVPPVLPVLSFDSKRTDAIYFTVLVSDRAD